MNAYLITNMSNKLLNKLLARIDYNEIIYKIIIELHFIIILQMKMEKISMQEILQ